jgi:hypothetical protein
MVATNLGSDSAGLLISQRRMKKKRREKKLELHEPSLPPFEQEMQFNVPFGSYFNTDFIILIYTIIYTY